MNLDIKELKHIRKKLGLTQQQLAQHAKVSQSLIAKIESNRIDPTYSNVQKIEQALDTLSNNQEQKAQDIMQRKVISVKPNDTIRSVIAKMKKYSISQLPVINNHTAVGTISETALLDGLLHEKGDTVQELMQEAPPILSKETRLHIISHVLQFSSMVLVAEKGKLIGLITKADVLEKMK